MKQLLTLATRATPMAVKQAELAQIFFEKSLGVKTELLKCSTSGDRQQDWSLEKQGGTGLFVKELQAVLMRGEADVAIHSAKDMPSVPPEGLAVAGYLKRDDPRDVLVMREGVEAVKTIATGSPRRRAQLLKRFPDADWMEIRGTGGTRLKKIADGYADATVLAQAGLERLGVSSYPGLSFEILEATDMVPAVGQGAIAFECMPELAKEITPHVDPETLHAVTIERAFLKALGGGCHTSFAAYYKTGVLSVFHESLGFVQEPLDLEMGADLALIEARIDAFVAKWKP